MKKEILRFLWGGLFVLSIQAVLACSCAEPKKFTINDYIDYDVVLKGEIISVKHMPDTVFIDTLWGKEIRSSFGGYYEVMVKVAKVYKGSGLDSNFIFKTPASTGVNCTVTFNEGEEWFLFADETKNEYWIGGCSWSDRVKYDNKSIRKALKYVEKMVGEKQKHIRESYWDKKVQVHRKYVTGTLQNGKAEGVWTYAYRKGSPYMNGSFKNGIREGLWQYRFTVRNWSAGTVMYKFIYENGVKQGFVEYDRKGKIINGWILKGYQPPHLLFTDAEIQQMSLKEY